eukprot:gnl/MRDRNA2_/MRDRNA2_36192_c0_seq1.p1 gnl/MRDRNA2_/MRDRNA2_36192_c0~~gnl/MRDRNA2_/MRDRNA2_36192_c0_seq1.p1  ORF type:complete len:917 (+),score=216.59 gnl/MRDRNA2_/MRDRNA2_36192_c0_seq1:76-2751(+)
MEDTLAPGTGTGATSDARSASERMQHALAKLKKRREVMESLPNAQVQLRVPCERSTTQSEDVRSRLPDLQKAVGKALASQEVHLKDVSLDVVSSASDGSIGIETSIKICSGSSVLAVVEALNEKLQNSNANYEICSILHGLGVNLDKIPAAVAKWPLERIQAAIEMDYGYRIALDQLEVLVSAAEESYQTYFTCWQTVTTREKRQAARLMEEESMSIFEGALLAVSQGRRKGLAEDWVVQEAEALNDLLEDAMEAQKRLKQQLAPEESWGITEFNDSSLVPIGDVRRKWHSSKGHLAPCGEHFDPGIKGKDRVWEKAKSRQKDYMVQPPFNDLVDISRMAVVFDSVECLTAALTQIVAAFDVVWVDNKFRNPSCVGYRDINLGIRHRVGEHQRVHLSEFQLLLRDFYVVKQGDGHKYYEKIRTTLANCGVSNSHCNGILQLILRMLDCTNGQASRDAAFELQEVATFVDRFMVALGQNGAPLSEMDLAKELVTEFASSAIAAGVPGSQVMKSLENLVVSSSEENNAQFEQLKQQARQADCVLLDEKFQQLPYDEFKKKEQFKELEDLLGKLQASGTVLQFVVNANSIVAWKFDGNVVHWGNHTACREWDSIKDQEFASGVRSLHATERAHAVLSADGSVVVWGDREYGGNCEEVQQQLASGVQSVCNTSHAFAALKDDGTAVVWGPPSPSPYAKVKDEEKKYTQEVQAQLSSGIQSICSNKGAFAALKDDGSVVAWGNAKSGSFQSTTKECISAQAQLTSGVQNLYATENAFAALKTDGSIVPWGAAYLQAVSEPLAKLQGDGLVSSVTNTYNTYLKEINGIAALKTDGSVTVWGYDSSESYKKAQMQLTNDVQHVKVFERESTVSKGLIIQGFEAIKADGSEVRFDWGAK